MKRFDEDGPCEKDTESKSETSVCGAMSPSCPVGPGFLGVWHNEPMTSPLVAIVGREISQAEGVRGEAFGAGRRYSDAIHRAGGTPIIVPPLDLGAESLERLVSAVDALVLHGGGDVDPRRYGQEPTAPKLYGVNSRHDDVELDVVRAFLDADKPILAICRGIQIMNVALGGTLVQHIEEPGHTQEFHSVTLDEGSLAADAMGTSRPARCHSYHHQALDRVADGLRVIGRHDDGTIEAVEAGDKSWVVGVQWHPEDSADVDPEQQRLFDRLVEVSR
jgi:putative glutamine amidotransferase